MSYGVDDFIASVKHCFSLESGAVCAPVRGSVELCLLRTVQVGLGSEYRLGRQLHVKKGLT